MSRALSALLTALCFLLTAVCHAADKVPLQPLVVKPGDTLWSISQKYLKDPQRWPEILKYNDLPTDDPTVTLPGMTLRVPVVLIKENLRSARVLQLSGEVLYRRKQTTEWLGAGIGLDMFPADSMRTMRLSEASLRFGTGETLQVRENSLVILAPPKLDADAQLLKGQISARRSTVMTATAKVTPKTRDTEYTTRVMDDLRTLVQVYQGNAAVEAQGKTVDVPAGFGSEVRLDQAPSMPQRLPALPDFAERRGEGRASAEVTDGRLRLDLAAAKLPGAGTGRSTVMEGARYRGVRLQAARDEAFKELALDREVGLREAFDFTQELRPGRYWWRLALVDALGFESSFTRAQPLDLEFKAPPLEVERPGEAERVLGPREPRTVVVQGRTEPEAELTIDGQRVEVDREGRFSTALNTKEGARTLRLRARNRWGTTEVDRRFTYEIDQAAEPVAAAKPVEPEKSFEERVVKPYVIPALSVVVFAAIIILLL